MRVANAETTSPRLEAAAPRSDSAARVHAPPATRPARSGASGPLATTLPRFQPVSRAMAGAIAAGLAVQALPNDVDPSTSVRHMAPGRRGASVMPRPGVTKSAPVSDSGPAPDARPL